MKQSLKKKCWRAYDGTLFKNTIEGAAYDEQAVRKNAEKIWFVALDSDSKNSFDSIKPKNYNIISFLHSAKVLSWIEYFERCPIIICANDVAAQVFMGIFNSKFPAPIMLNFKKGINFWKESMGDFVQLEHYLPIFEGLGETSDKFFSMIDTIQDFINSNIKGDI